MAARKTHNPTKTHKLSIEKICDELIAGESYIQIAKKNKISIGALHKFLCTNENSARAREAREISADSYVDKAAQAINSLRSNAKAGSIVKARELALHYRWLAGKRKPTVYGDKIDVTTGGQTLPGIINIFRDDSPKLE